MSRNYLNSQAFRNYDASYNGRVWTEPANTHGIEPEPVLSDVEEAEDAPRREWTPTDAACAEDDRIEREWWRKRGDDE
jgi:hypothetical protein